MATTNVKHNFLKQICSEEFVLKLNAYNSETTVHDQFTAKVCSKYFEATNLLF